MNRILLGGLAALSLAAATSGAPAAAQNGAPPFVHPPMMGGRPGGKDPAVEKSKAEALKLEKQLKARPNDAKLKLKTADAFYKYGHTMMYSPALMPREKYRGALAEFRVALKYNPKHAQAAGEKKMIEDIYRQMGRPIPQ